MSSPRDGSKFKVESKGGVSSLNVLPPSGTPWERGTGKCILWEKCRRYRDGRHSDDVANLDFLSLD